MGQKEKSFYEERTSQRKEQLKRLGFAETSVGFNFKTVNVTHADVMYTVDHDWNKHMDYSLKHLQSIKSDFILCFSSDPSKAAEVENSLWRMQNNKNSDVHKLLSCY